MNGKIIIGILAVAAGAVAYKCWKDSKTVHTGKLVKKTWERSVKVQEYKETIEKGKVVPDGAVVVNRSTKTNISAQTILDNVNLNTRTGRISLPDIKTETIYSYKIKKWVTIATRTIAGIDTVPHDPDVNLVNPWTSGDPELGQQRKIPAGKKFRLVFADEEGIWHEVCATEEDYRTLTAGDKVFFKKVCGAYKIVGAEPASKEEVVDEKAAEQGETAEVVTPMGEPDTSIVPEGSYE